MKCEKSRDFVKGIESLGYEPKKIMGLPTTFTNVREDLQ
jgi:hypothetical protein